MKSRAKCRLHLRYSLVFKDFTYQGRLTKLNFFPPREQLKLQFGTPASLNTEAYTERRGKKRLRYSFTTSMSVIILLNVFLIKVPSKPNAKPMAIKR